MGKPTGWFGARRVWSRSQGGVIVRPMMSSCCTITNMPTALSILCQGSFDHLQLIPRADPLCAPVVRI